MQFPNFSESQLQQLYNDNFAKLWPIKPAGYFIPILISSHQEKDKGYDTGFRVPWIRKVDPNNKLCNYFIQYKLAYLCDHPTSGQFRYWHQPYFRFPIPHETVSYSGRVTEYSYHQFQALKSLSEKGFSANYCANSTIYDWELFNWYSTGQMTEMNPTIDIADIDISVQHRYITFTENSTYFLQHSEPKEIKRIPSEMAIERIFKGTMTSIVEDLETIPIILSEFPGFTDIYGPYKQAIGKLSIEEDWAIMHFFVSILLNVTWMKLPSG